MLRDEFQTANLPPPLDLADIMSRVDRAEVELIRLEALLKKFDKAPERQLKIFNQMIGEAVNGGLAETIPDQVSGIYERRGELLVSLGQQQQAAESLQIASRLQTDPKLKELLNEMALEVLARQ